MVNGWTFDDENTLNIRALAQHNGYNLPSIADNLASVFGNYAESIPALVVFLDESTNLGSVAVPVPNVLISGEQRFELSDVDLTAPLVTYQEVEV